MLHLFDGGARVRTFGVATGQACYPTPSGSSGRRTCSATRGGFRRTRDWARGPSRFRRAGNPLGTRWMGISAPGVGIHGTPDAASIGYSASHGCIRMHIPDAEWLYQRVALGMPGSHRPESLSLRGGRSMPR